MFSVDGPCFLLAPFEQNGRLMIPGLVRQVRSGGIVVRFDDPILTKPGDTAILLSESRQTFLQQPAKVHGVQSVASDSNSEACLIEFTFAGEPAPAGKRGCYRVSVAGSDLHASVNDQPDCRVVDISAEGLAVICQPLVGHTVKVDFTHAGITVKGQMNVQTCRPLNRGRHRYGLSAGTAKSPLRSGLQKLAALLQRSQLKRLAGAA